jgi:thiol-disulfide isomerase/thioredoxin
VKRRDLLQGLVAALVLQPACAVETPGFLRRPWPASQPTPPLDLAGFEGPRWNLAQEGRGKVVLLNFWASWCEPCRSEMPALELLAQRYEKQGLVVVAVNHRETDAAIRRFMELMPISLTVLRDSDGASSRAWGARMFPTSVLVGRDGRARWSIIGEMDWNGAEARQTVEALL